MSKPRYILNCINPSESHGSAEAWAVTVNCISSGTPYDQAAQILRQFDYYIPEDQYIAMSSMINIQMDLDIGNRRGEIS